METVPHKPHLRTLKGLLPPLKEKLLDNPWKTGT
jgi:hypothetical protein